jgi:MFS family permease
MQTDAKQVRSGLKTFGVIWFGQLVSTLGSGLTGFALGVWLYQQTGSTTLFSISLLAYALPNLVLAPFSGALVDRWDRRKAMILSDTGAGLSTLAIFLLMQFGELQTWQVILAIVVNASFSTLQWPAYSASTTLLVPKEHLGRAGGMVQIGEAISQLIAPALAGAMLVTTGLQGVVLVDFITFAIAVGTLLVVRIPQPPVSAESQAQRGSLWQEAAFGWKYITARRGLLGLLGVFAAINLLSSFIGPLIIPMLLDMTTAGVLGVMLSIVGVGMLAGTLVMSAWGGPKRRIHGVLGFMMIAGGATILLGVSSSLVIICIAGFLATFTSPITNASSQAIWQSKVAPDVQGRVFSIRRMIAWSMIPLAYVLAGPLADQVFKPLLVSGGPLADSLGVIFGVGPSRGIGLFFVVTGLLSVLVAGLGYLNPHVRNVEDELPDAITQEPESQNEATLEIVAVEASPAD